MLLRNLQALDCAHALHLSRKYSQLFVRQVFTIYVAAYRDACLFGKLLYFAVCDFLHKSVLLLNFNGLIVAPNEYHNKGFMNGFLSVLGGLRFDGR